MEVPSILETPVCPSSIPNGDISDATSSRPDETTDTPQSQACSSLVFSTVTKATGSSENMAEGGDETAKERGNKRVINNRKTVRKVKNITMGEFPLRPVGLSLSGSGMQLYVKVDNFLQKEQLANLESQFVAKVCQMNSPAAGKLGRRKLKRRDQTMQSAEANSSSQPSDKHADGLAASCPPPSKMETSDSHSTEFSTTRPTHCDEAIVIDEDAELSATEDDVSDFDAVIKEEILDVEYDGGNVDKREDDQNKSAITSLVENCSTSLVSPGDNRTFSHQRCGAQKLAGSYPVAPDGKGKNFAQQEQGEAKRSRAIQANPDQGWAVVRPKAVRPKSQEKQKKRCTRSVFTSKDLPLKRLGVIRSCSSAEILIHQQRNNSGFFSPVRPLEPDDVGERHTFCSTNNAAPRLLSRNGLANSSEDAMSPGMARETPSSKYALVDSLSSGANTRTLSSPHQEVSNMSSPGVSTTNRQLARNHSDSDPSHDTRREAEAATPISLAELETAQALASGVVDAETLAKFAEYTSSMRRDLKQGYKKLSELMKNFNQELMEQYREQVTLDMDTNASAGPDSESDAASTSGRRRRCIVM